MVIGTNIPPEFIPSCEKGAKTACEKGVLAGHALSGVRVVLTDGAAHMVDSSDMAFQLAMQYGIRQAVKAAKPMILEPVMNLEVNSPSEFQGSIMGGINKRNGMIMATDLSEDGSAVRIVADVPLSQVSGWCCPPPHRIVVELTSGMCFRCSGTARSCGPALRARESSQWSTRSIVL